MLISRSHSEKLGSDFVFHLLYIWVCSVCCPCRMWEATVWSLWAAAVRGTHLYSCLGSRQTLIAACLFFCFTLQEGFVEVCSQWLDFSKARTILSDVVNTNSGYLWKYFAVQLVNVHPEKSWNELKQTCSA